MILATLKLVVIYTLFLGYALGGVVTDTNSCSRIECQVSNNRKFKYQERTFYLYHYQLQMSTNLSHKQSCHEPLLHINADVIIYFTSPCEGTLRFLNVSISHDNMSYRSEFPDRAGADFRKILEKNAVRFVFNDGEIRELCPNADDEPWALNLRRGFLSIFQNTMLRFDVDDKHHELDINGICQTYYQLSEAEGTSLVIRKWKDMATCQYATRHFSVIQSNSYKSQLSQAHRYRQPFFTSASRCRMKIDHNIYHDISCHDHINLRSFISSGGVSGGTEIISEMKLLGELPEFSYKNGIDSDITKDSNFPITKRANLLYSHDQISHVIDGELRNSRDILKIMCNLSTSQELRENFSEGFTNFIQSSRMLDFQSLSQLYHRAENICGEARKHILDALPFIGSNAAVNVMKNLILDRSIDDKRVGFWVTSFTFLPRPDLQTIHTLSVLFHRGSSILETGAQFVLSYASVIHSYCSDRPFQCTAIKSVGKFTASIGIIVRDGCEPRHHDIKDSQKTLVALKAIGNAGIELEELEQQLERCVLDESGFIPMELKVAAIEAHRRMPSCEIFRDGLLSSIYKNVTFDSELRIASYLQIMRCPNYNTIKMIRQILHTENVNQVGSFVWSHLKNMLSSSSPTRIEIQSLLTDRDLSYKFNSDFRKFSRNFESSFFSEEYNFGASHQTNVVFSTKSYIPRGISFNSSLDVLGESINLLELNIRLEGFEFYVEKFFAPQNSLSAMEIAKYFHRFLRSSTYPENLHTDFWERIRDLPNVIDNDFERPRLSLSYKIFGNEISFAKFDDDREIRTALTNLNPWEKMKQILTGQGIFEYEGAGMLLDTAYVMPTTPGLPVRMASAASFACNVKLSGILDSQRFLSNGELEVIGNFKPSVSIDLTGTMSVDAFSKRIGIKFKSSIHSVSAFEANLKTNGLELARLSLRLPKDRMELLSLKTDIVSFTVNGAEYREQSINLACPKTENQESVIEQLLPWITNAASCSWSALDHLIGLKLCTEYKLPRVAVDPNAAISFLTGPTTFKLSLIKADPSADNYLLEYTWTRTEETSVLKFSFDTPGSRIAREISATLSFDVRHNNVSLHLKSKGNALLAHGTYKKTDSEVFIRIGLNSHGKEHLDVFIGYSRSKIKHGHTYSPRILLEINNERVVNLTGIIRNQERNNASDCHIDLHFQTRNLTTRMLGYIQRNDGSISGNIRFDYRLHEKYRDEVLQTEFSLINKLTEIVTYRSADMKLYSTAYPRLNFIAGLRYQHTSGRVEIHLEINTQPHLHDSERHKLATECSVTYSKPYFQADGMDLTLFVAIKKPARSIDFMIIANYHSATPNTRTQLLIHYAPKKEISLNVDLLIPKGNLLVLEGNISLTIPSSRSMSINASILEYQRDEFCLDFIGTWFSSHNMTAKGTYRDRSTTVAINHDLQMRLASPSFSSDISLKSKLYSDIDSLSVGLSVDQIGMDEYVLTLNHTSTMPNFLRTIMEARYMNNTYVIRSDLDLSRQAVLQMHLDKWRDINVTLTGIDENVYKKYGVDVQWDASRDPNLKFSFGLQLQRCLSIDEMTSVDLKMMISYPGRHVTGSWLMVSKIWNHHVLDAQITWGDTDSVRLAVETEYEFKKLVRMVRFRSQMATPFESLRRISISTEYSQSGSQGMAKVGIYWQDQYILCDLVAMSTTSGWKKVDHRVNFGLMSTISSIESVAANLTHIHIYAEKADSRIIIKYHSDKVIEARSIWLIQNNEGPTFNVTGDLYLRSPITSFRKGELRCHWSHKSDWEFGGLALMGLDKKKYTAHLVGDLSNLLESTIQLNITTPLRGYSYIRGRFGLSKQMKHIVAEFRSPTRSLGIEGMSQLFTKDHDLNLRLSLSTPLDILQQASLVAKYNQQEVDFGVTYNNISAGFQGVWCYYNISNFHYRYILLTPLPGLQKMGVITKFAMLRGDSFERMTIDTEFSLQVVKHKAGIKVHAGPNDLPSMDVNIKSIFKYMRDSLESEDASYDGLEDDFYWHAEVELDTIIVETVKGTLDFDREGYIGRILGQLTLPPGEILLEDHFYMKDFFHIQNDLSIETPFNSSSEISSIFDLDIDPQDQNCLLRMIFKVKDDVKWAEASMDVNYTYKTPERRSYQLHILDFDVKTPVSYLKSLESKMTFEIDESNQELNISLSSGENTMEFVGLLKQYDGVTETNGCMNIRSPIFYVPRLQIVIKRDHTQGKNDTKLNILMGASTMESIKFQATWSSHSHEVKGSASLDTFLEPFVGIEVSYLFSNSLRYNQSLVGGIDFKHHHIESYKLHGQLVRDKIVGSMEIEGISGEFVLVGEVVEVSNGLYHLSATLENEFEEGRFDVIATLRLDDGRVSNLDVKISPHLDYTPAPSTKNLMSDGDNHKWSNVTIMMLSNDTNSWNLSAGITGEDTVRWTTTASLHKKRDEDTYFHLHIMTPLEQVKEMSLDGTMLLDKGSGHVHFVYRLDEIIDQIETEWRMINFSDMLVGINVARERDIVMVKTIDASFFYKNLRNSSEDLDLGFKINIDQNEWHLGSRLTLHFDNFRDIHTIIRVKLPPPNNDTHLLNTGYRAMEGHHDLSYRIGYSTEVTKVNYSSVGQMKMEEDKIDGLFHLSWGIQECQTVKNFFNLEFNGDAINFKDSLYTPNFLREETLILSIGYDPNGGNTTLITSQIHYPGRREFGSAKISFENLMNVNGTLDMLNPFKNFSNARCEFLILTDEVRNKRYISVTWPNDSAIIDSDITYHVSPMNSEMKGLMTIEFPLNTRHSGIIIYDYKNDSLLKTGQANLTYNSEDIAQCYYECRSTFQSGFENDDTKIIIKNDYKPVEITYVYQNEYNRSIGSQDYSTITLKKVNIYQLNNASLFNISGLMKIYTNQTGQEMNIETLHFDRRIRLDGAYDLEPNEFTQNARLRLSNDTWLSYHAEVVNYTTISAASQSMRVRIRYPGRNFTVGGSYSLEKSLLHAEANLSWEGESQSFRTKERNIAAFFKWINDSSPDEKKYGQSLTFGLRHPSFKRDVTIKGHLMQGPAPKKLMSLNLVGIYSLEKAKILSMNIALWNYSESPSRHRYSYSLDAEHLNTKLVLKVRGHLKKYTSQIAELISNASFRRSFLPEEMGGMILRARYADNEIELERRNNDLLKYFQVRYYPSHPSYVINGSAIDGNHLNVSGAFVLDLQTKLIELVLNHTPDAVESFKLYGNVPDVRNAAFNVYRTYDQDLIISDIAFYVRLNHSRLVTSKLKWRPELKSDIVDLIKRTVRRFYEELNADLSYWKHYIKSETMNVMTDVWTDAQDDLEDFLEDFRDLRTVHDDFNRLKIYLNNSYNANDFYIKDILVMGSHLYSELALHEKFQSLPNIINEIWEVMGESGYAIRNSLIWIIETIKNAFQKCSEIISMVLKGDLMNQITSFFESFVMKYDMLVKEVHVSFIKYIEYIYKGIHLQLSQQWHRFLMYIEPAFIQLAHYLDTVGWKATQEFYNFLYDRKIELIASPYYDSLAKFAQDIDKLYQDLKSSDVITNIEKYTSIVIEFIRDRYLTILPFSNELQDVINEVWNEIKELGKLPSFKYASEKTQQVYERISYLYKYFEVRARLERFVRFIYVKFIEISQTALQAESKYREAKTKFIYDPRKGLMCFEQKLPMSWHAFNQSPEFQEIPEYRAIADLRSYFMTSNTTFWTLYYKIKPLTEPSNWLPPFKAQAMIIGARNIKTFDGRLYSFEGSCTYLAAYDFVHSRFAILIKYIKGTNDTIPKHQIVILVGSDIVQLDLFRNDVKVVSRLLDMQIPTDLDNGTTYLYRDDNLVTVERKDRDFRVECNMKYNLCVLELSGWYFGKTAGLLGTMNNEPMDDFLASNGLLQLEADDFARSWILTGLEPENQGEDADDTNSRPLHSSHQNYALNSDIEKINFCNDLFVNRSSEFSPCFGIVEPDPFHSTCIDSHLIEDACSVGMAYLQICMFHDNYLRIPDKCTSCIFDDEASLEIFEGDFRKLEGDSVPKSTDIIFIVEAKQCNRELRTRRNIDQLISHISSKLEEDGFRNNRWSLVIFGGDGVYDEPRNRILDNQIFTKNSSRFVDYFNGILVGDGSKDILGAIRFTAQLVFRAGVSKTFILMPCSHCNADEQSLDHLVLYHALQEQGILLHILMNGDLQTERKRSSKLFYGLDAQRLYTKKNLRQPNEDIDLHHHVKLSKNALGYCAPLALETNGSIFSGSKLNSSYKVGAVKKFARAFSERLVLTAQPSPCQLCECIANNDGLTQMECTPCNYPMPIAIDSVKESITEDDSMSLQSSIEDYDLVDMDED